MPSASSTARCRSTATPPSARSQDKVAGPLAARALRKPRSASCRSPMPRCRSRCARSRSTRASIRATPRMIAFGGAGPLHAVAIAREIFIPQGDRAEGAGHVLGARHADGVVAAGLRAHAVSACSARSTRAQVDAVFAELARGRPATSSRATASLRGSADFRLSSPTCAMSARSTPSRSRSRAPALLTGDFATLRERFRRRARPALRPGRARRADGDRQPPPGGHRRARRYAGRALAVASRGCRSRRSPTSGAT